MNDLQTLAHSLGVTTESLEALGVSRNGLSWLIPERDADGVIIGTAKRFDHGNKGFVPGGNRGLTYIAPLDNYAGSSMASPVFIVEGMSDVAAGLSMGVDIIGRPSATGGVKLLAAILKDRHVVIIGEHDDAGRKGAEAIAEQLSGACATVRIIYPPAEYKDLRAWYTAPGGAIKHDLECAAADAEEYQTKANIDKEAKKHRPVLIRAADIQPTTVRWLWPGRIPRGRMTLMVGRPGGGKSFATADFAARVSQGRDWPDGTPCNAGSVLVCNAEDDPADTTIPRLIAHDANLDKISLFTGVRYSNEKGEDRERVFVLADLEPLRDALDQLTDCRLIVVDPIGSYLGGQADANRDNEVRGVLAPLCKLAEEYDAAILVIAHTRKSVAAHADDTAMGSRAFTGLARSVLHLMQDPDDTDAQRRLLLPGKNNLSEKPEGLAFEIGNGFAVDDDGNPRPCIQWQEGTVNITADEVVNRRNVDDDGKASEKDEAVDWLRQALAAGSRPSKDVIEEAREVEGISKRTLERAKKDLGVEAYRPKNPGPWRWRLPTAEHTATTPPDE